MPDMNTHEILVGDCRETLKTLPEKSVHCCVTSPPYWGLRDYGHDGQMGLEKTPDEYVRGMVEVFREVRRVLRDDGTLWLNLGDSYSERVVNLPEKNLVGIPWRVAFALQADGWYLRQDIIWHKPNPMPESVRDRCTKAHEYIFLLSKSAKYYYDQDSVLEPCALSHEARWDDGENGLEGGKSYEGKGSSTRKFSGDGSLRNKRSVWTVTTKPYKGAHFATFPPRLIKPCILAGCPADGQVLDPFGGSGTTAAVAIENGRNAIICELNEEYVGLADERIAKSVEQVRLDSQQPQLL